MTFPRLSKRAKVICGIVTLIGIFLSVTNELGSVNLYQFGVASITRPLHATLGIIALTWVLFGYRLGAAALVAWIVSAIPVIGVDQSKEFVNPIFELCIKKVEHSSRTLGSNHPMITSYSSVGVNLAPVLFAAWFWFCTKATVFPLTRWKIATRQVKTVTGASLVVIALVLIGGGFYLRWVMSAPYVIVAAEPGMSFYYQDEKLGDRFLRVTPELMNKVGLNGDLPADQWIIYTGNPSPWGFGIFLDDGTCPVGGRKLISIATNSDDPDLVRQDTPWGERIQPRRASKNEQDGRFRYFGMARNTAFYVRPDSPSQPVPAGEPFLLNVSIETRKEQPRFERLRFRTVLLPLSAQDGDYPRRDTDAEAPDAFRKLNHQSHIEGELPVQAPYRPGVYLLLINGWMYDKNGDYATPIRSLGYSSYALVTVVE